ncbi:IgGFc-binding protein [Toxocara canis]|uniref:IgGFc-binding protein n=1 Tax=Toxocara canis TaxID=6265 RepID=A0A0B2VPK8_TOXCA|nr:IgGFc-binding protein [Toxocara canis]
MVHPLKVVLLLCVTFTTLEAFRSARRKRSSDDCPTGDHSMECRSKAELQEIIADLKKTIIAQQESINPNCTSCWSGPCMNGGKCTPIDASTYRCDCPEEFVGEQCEKKLKCHSNTCGANAICSIGNHQIMCVCPMGFTGNPRVSCAQRTVTASMVGDPHYTTFDGRSFDYMGLCPHYFVVPCNDTLPPPFGRFVVKAKNTPSYSNAQVSNVDEMEVELYGLSLYSNVRTFDLFVNRISTTMPFFYPNKENAKISVTFHNHEMRIRSDTNILVRFNKRKLSVQMPDVEELRGSDILCGLAGNINSDCKDDLRKRDGTLLNSESCSSTTKVNEFGDSYIITEANHFISENGMIDNGPCKKGAEMGSPQNDCDMEEAKRLCKPIIDVKRGKGIFSRCMKLPVTEIDRSYEACVYDTCYGRAKGSDDKTFCNSLELFAEKCQLYLPNTPLKWRVRSGCDELQCPLHAIAKECASACPRTCHNPNPPIECNEPCSEGCECEPGFYLDDSDPIKSVCIPLEECGCNDENGNHHAAAETWVNENCSTISHCDKGIAKTEAKNCSANAVCAIHSTALVRRCICKEGFEGDGYTCDDIDECADPQTCNAGLGHGKCNNTPGSYVCKCHPDYDSDPNCQYYRPRRHCADLFKYHNIVKSGVYNIRPFSSIDGPEADIMISVYCDMTTEGGGWTLMSGSLSDSMSNKTFDEYVTGFGDPAIKDVWLGLDIIHQMTVNEDTSLRVNLHYCAKRLKQKNLKMNIPARSTYCTYPSFKVHNRSRQYVVEIPYACEGTDESNEDDGWVRWDGKYGPKFTAYDSANATCSKFYRNTGWWFDDEDPSCGSANLNGNRYKCEARPNTSEIARYLKWNSNCVGKAELFLRPSNFDEHKLADQEALEDEGSEAQIIASSTGLNRTAEFTLDTTSEYQYPSPNQHSAAENDTEKDEKANSTLAPVNNTTNDVGNQGTSQSSAQDETDSIFTSRNWPSQSNDHHEQNTSTLRPIAGRTTYAQHDNSFVYAANDTKVSVALSNELSTAKSNVEEQRSSILDSMISGRTDAQHDNPSTSEGDEYARDVLESSSVLHLKGTEQPDNSTSEYARDVLESSSLLHLKGTEQPDNSTSEYARDVLESSLLLHLKGTEQPDNPTSEYARDVLESSSVLHLKGTEQPDHPTSEYARDVLESSSVLHLKGTEQPDKPTSESIFTESSNAQHYSSFASAVRGNLPDALSGRLQPPLNETDQRNKLTTESTEGTEGFTGEDQFPSKTAKRAEMTTTEEIASTEQTAMQTKITTQPQVATTRWEGRTSEHRVSGTTKMSFTGSARRVTRDWKNEATLRRRPEDIEWTTREAIIDLTAIEDY